MSEKLSTKVRNSLVDDLQLLTIENERLREEIKRAADASMAYVAGVVKEMEEHVRYCVGQSRSPTCRELRGFIHRLEGKS